MQPLFTPEGLRALDVLLSRRPLLAFDLDGTLAPLAEHPDQARVPEPMRLALQRIDRHWPVAVISGRSIAGVRRTLAFEPSHLLGSHGAEDEVEPDPALARVMDPVRVWCKHARAELAAEGIWVEDKGLSMALHDRHARDPARALALRARLLAALPASVRGFNGKDVLNLAVATAPDKADGLERLMRRSGAQAALFVGDDVNDEPVFRRRHPDWLTVRVGPPDQPSAARWRVDDIATVGRLLAHVAAHLPASLPARVDEPSPTPR